MSLYKALALPIIEYGAHVIVSALKDCSKEFGKIQRCGAIIRASGCLGITSTDTLDVLTNAIPIDLHLTMIQSQ